MPPPKENDRLSEGEVHAVKLWIEGGAVFENPPETKPALSQHDVIPILYARCTVCHGLRKQETELDLRTVEGMLKGGLGGPALTPGDPDKSPMYKRVADGLCPPKKLVLDYGVKLPSDDEARKIRQWIALGAPMLDKAPDVASEAGDPLVSDEDRKFWAFQPPRDVAVPEVKDAGRIRNPVDAFVLNKLEEKGLTLAAEADRPTLIRRLYFDLTGLPPTDVELASHLSDPDERWYENMVERLLASPRYGEHWGRYWLDLAGYADSEGKEDQDLDRVEAYRYRDYVVRSFNENKPYDRFLLEQIAGDELEDYEKVGEITEAMYDNLVATGFLRMVPDGTSTRDHNLLPERMDVIQNAIDVLASGVMGLTLKCARCHSHKYDPIPQRDYYRLRAVFKGALDEHDWMRPHVIGGVSYGSPHFGLRSLKQVTTAERRQWETDQAKLVEIEAPLVKVEAELQAKHFDEQLAAVPDELRGDLKAALDTPAEERTEIQKYLTQKFEPKLRVTRDQLKEKNPAFKALAEETDKRAGGLRKPEPMIRALWDRGDPSPTYILKGGEYNRFGDLVGPGVPSVLTDGKTPFVAARPWEGAKQVGTRLAFARWLTGPDHPLTARVMVNRVWSHHFGRGIVATLDNFGTTGAKPTHPELLDWLSRRFVASGWNIKHIHRLLVTSSTYRQESGISTVAQQSDPNNLFLSRMALRRLDPEELHDAVFLAAGRLNLYPFGPADPVVGRSDGSYATPLVDGAARRMLFVQHKRTRIPSIMETFDYPQMNPNCITRPVSTVATQALLMLNDEQVTAWAAALAQRVAKEAGSDPQRQVRLVYTLTMSRDPDEQELGLGVEALGLFTRMWQAHAETATLGEPEPGKETPTPVDPAAKALESYCHAVLNSSAFLYVN